MASDRKQGRIWLLAAGAVSAVLAGLLLAFLLNRSAAGNMGPPPASEGGLIIEARDPALRDDVDHGALDCYKDGRSVGTMRLADCAKLNGVASDKLEVGRTDTGLLAAVVTPIPAVVPLPPGPVVPNPAVAAPSVPLIPCWQHVNGNWQRREDQPSLESCMLLIYNGRCETPGSASYGRFGGFTLRLVPGRVETSANDRSFETAALVGDDCKIQIP